MVHSGYEATAVNDTLKSPLKALKVFLRGPNTSGPMAPEVPFHYEDEQATKPHLVIHEEKVEKQKEKQVA